MTATLAVRSDETPMLDLIRSFRIQIDADDKSPKTVEAYVESTLQFARFLADRGLPTTLPKIRREHIAAFRIYLRDERKASDSTRHIRLRGLRSFFDWAVEQKEITESPMAGMKLKTPKLQPVLFPKEAVVRKLINSVEHREDFESRRDAAILRIFFDTGCRRAELSGLRFNPASKQIDEVNDVSQDRDLVRVMGKGGYQRYLPLGRKTRVALDRYIRMARTGHPYSHLPGLWLCRKGKLTDGGIAQMVERRAKAAGVGPLHPHMLRHAFIDDALSHGMSEGDVMRITGHRSRKMLDRYASAGAVDRAIAAHRVNSPGDRI